MKASPNRAMENEASASVTSGPKIQSKVISWKEDIFPVAEKPKRNDVLLTNFRTRNYICEKDFIV